MRQRGTQFHPGQHVSHIALFGSKALITSPCAMQVGMGRDHTLFALVPGYVRFYKETRMRGERKYVGVVLRKGEKLPRDEAAHGRSRYFGFVNLHATAEQSTPTRTAA